MIPVTPVIPGSNYPEVIFKGHGDIQDLTVIITGDAVISRWRPNWKERLNILLSGNLWHWQIVDGRGIQPVMMTTELPKEQV